MRLWDAGGPAIDSAVLAFTVGDDPRLDRQLLPFDCLASAAHAAMLRDIGVLSAEEHDALVAALRQAYADSRAGTLAITPEQEDGHTALEAYLTEKAGAAGQKIHTGRSRNDQVIMALRLLVRERLLHLADAAFALVDSLLQRADEHAGTVMPGYTHTRQAMPSTVGQLFAAVAEGLIRDLDAWQVALHIAQRSALGSASGYGVPLPLDREQVAQLLGLGGIDLNTIHVQNTRGRLEAATLFALHQTSLTLGRFAADLVWFSSEAFGFFALPDELTTGSSIMPQKRNPDVLELVRAVPAAMLGRYSAVCGLLHGLAEGYQRDLQRTKEPLLAGLAEMGNVLVVMRHAIGGLTVDAERCRAALTPGIFATDRAYAYARAGEPFRSAYRRVKKEAPQALDAAAVLAGRSHLGAPGTLQGESLRRLADTARASLEPARRGAATARRLLEDAPAAVSSGPTGE